MKRTPLVPSLCMGLLVALGACGSPTGDDANGDDFACEGVPGQQFILTFTGDASFQGPHAGQVINDRLICVGGNPDSFSGSSGQIFPPPGTISFGVAPTVRSGEAYEIHLWIDSNVGGGTVGVCDPPAIDHQWRVPIPTVTGNVEILFSHNDATVTDVCASFAP